MPKAEKAATPAIDINDPNRRANQRVNIRLPEDPKNPENRDVHVWENGAQKLYSIPKGLVVSVPRAVAENIRNADKQTYRAQRYQIALEKDGGKDAASIKPIMI